VIHGNLLPWNARQHIAHMGFNIGPFAVAPEIVDPQESTVEQIRSEQ
jgi:hypothetical protein